MKNLYSVQHEILWEGEKNWDIFTSNIVAYEAKEAIGKHEKFLSKYSFIDDETKKRIKIKKFKLMEVKKIQSIDL